MSVPNTRCAFGDPGCPCQDGDVCHYVDDPLSETLAMRPPFVPDLCPECGTNGPEMVMRRGDEWVCSWCDHVYAITESERTP